MVDVTSETLFDTDLFRKIEIDELLDRALRVHDIAELKKRIRSSEVIVYENLNNNKYPKNTFIITKGYVLKLINPIIAYQYGNFNINKIAYKIIYIWKADDKLVDKLRVLGNIKLTENFVKGLIESSKITPIIKSTDRRGKVNLH
jgi:hypothetical protein